MAILLKPYNISDSHSHLIEPKGQSQFFGFPTLPRHIEHPRSKYYDDGEWIEEVMTFVCQINMADLVPFDTEHLLPPTGLLSFFAAIDEYLDPDMSVQAPGHNGIGEWTRNNFRVIYSPKTDNLALHETYYEDGSPAGPAAYQMTFEQTADNADGWRVLGQPFYDEVLEQTDSALINLLQVDESDLFGLRFYDCGMLNFLITEDDLRALRFDRVRCYMHSC